MCKEGREIERTASYKGQNEESLINQNIEIPYKRNKDIIDRFYFPEKIF